MKRSFSSIGNEAVACCTRSKKPRLVSPLVSRRSTRTWVAATHVRNFMIKDPLVDWLKLRNRRGTRTRPGYTQASGFTQFIMKQGVEFESELVKHINDNILPVTTVAEFLTDEGCQKTIDLMKAGTPILHSAPVKNHVENTGGIIDLLVRSDYLDQLIGECPISELERVIPAPNLGGSYHYVVIDVKFSTLPLRADGRLLLNSGSFPAYKAQTWIYTQAISQIQGYTSQYAFIMGRRWRYTNKDIKYHNYTCLDKLGTIDFLGADKEYVQRTKDAIKWVRDVQAHGDKWVTNPPSRPELYPNMCVESGVWDREKERIAKEIGEITSVWYCGVKHRQNAISRGITSWKDKNCTTDAIGMRGTRAPIVEKIMAINRQKKDKIWPKKIKSDMYNWKNRGNEMFVDFETMSDIFSDFSDLPNQNGTDMIFMIGVGWAENGVWKYKNFICNEPTRAEEYRIMDEFVALVKEREDPKLYYWHAEKSFWNRAETRQFDVACDRDDEVTKDHISDNWQDCNDWADLCTLFRSEPIVLKGCFKFGLKAIAKAMRSHKMISARIESECDSGMAAMVKAWNCYKTSSTPATSGVMNDIAKYNEFDCKVLWEIIEYLRKNHA